MKRIRILPIALILAGLVAYTLSRALFPNDVRSRRIVRDDPLRAPVTIRAIRGNKLVAARLEFKLAGVEIPASIYPPAREFLRLATAQGVEIIRVVDAPSACILRCEPRIWHWCGNDRVAAHYQQLNLNELILAFGYATFDGTASGLNKDERLRLRAAELVAKRQKRGVWSPAPEVNYGSFHPEFGLNVSEILSIRTMIDLRAEDLETDEFAPTPEA